MVPWKILSVMGNILSFQVGDIYVDSTYCVLLAQMPIVGTG